MLFDGLEKKNNRYMVGYDLGEYESQISYCSLVNPAAETVPVVAGSEQYNIPTALCKRTEVSQWFYGKEALRVAEMEEGTLVTGLLEKACAGELVEIEGREYDPIALLTLFVKRSFGLFSMQASLDKIEILVITVRDLDGPIVSVLEQVVSGLGLKTDRIFFQSYKESFYYYMLHQPAELWTGEPVIFDMQKDKMTTYILECNKRTIPTVTFSCEADFSQFPIEDENAMDQEFYEVAASVMYGREISVVFLIGDGFRQDNLDVSLRFLCKDGRRTFKGNNLYSKGAAYGAAERLCPSKRGKEYVFLGIQKLKSNLGFQMMRDGQESYKTLLDAGVNWYDAKAKCQFYLETGNKIFIAVTPLTNIRATQTAGGKYPVIYEEITLEGLPERPQKTTRLELRAAMSDVQTVQIEIEDLGFGEIVKPTHQIWKKTIILN